MECENGDLVSSIEGYDVIEQIGRGSFGAAYLVLQKIEKKKYVLKKIRLSKQTEKFKRTAHQEMELISNLKNPYIVEYKDAWADKDDSVCIVTGYCEGGDIAEMIKKAKGAFFPEEKLCKWLSQMLLAVDYLHSNRVLHGDLKCSNIFLTKDNDIRLGDFGLAKLLNSEELASSVVGTPNYMCPELLADIPYGYKSDIWSLGCCMFEMAAHQPAFRAPDMAGLINKINRSSISPLPIVYSSTLKQIIKSMLRKSPEHRPTAAELLRHAHLQPYVLQCRNPAPVFLPISGSKDKPKKSPAKKPGPKPTRERESASVESGSANVTPRKEKLRTEERLETKRVDPTSCSAGPADSDLSVSQKESAESEAEVTSFCPDEPEDSPSLSAAKCLQRLENVDIVTVNIEEEGKMYFSQEGLGGEEVEVEEKKTGSDEVAAPKESSDLGMKVPKDQSRVGSLVSALSALGLDEAKVAEWENPGQQRADVLESLLELCARLLKQEKIDELAGVLRPFGEDAVSSRETAIWLTKSLMSTHKKLDADT